MRPRLPSKQATCIALLRQGNGASILKMMKATGWQSHSVRGFLLVARRECLGIHLVNVVPKMGRNVAGGQRLANSQIGPRVKPPIEPYWPLN